MKKKVRKKRKKRLQGDRKGKKKKKVDNEKGLIMPRKEGIGKKRVGREKKEKVWK